jgi:hypothetical protein
MKKKKRGSRTRARRTHEELLQDGVGAWNEWRRKHPKVTPDLRRAYLRDADLSEPYIVRDRLHLDTPDLSRAEISDADLHGANLRGADLSRAILRRANLTDADLRESNLGGADLSEADLNGANLSESNLAAAILNAANLSRTNFGSANLEGSDVTFALLFGTIFGNNDLSRVTGLGAVQHLGPSTIGIDTFYRSRGKIPEGFLLGTGVPAGFVSQMRSAVKNWSKGENPFDYYSCFISYSTRDRRFVQRLHADLQKTGVRCWFAPVDLGIGDKYRTRIHEAILSYDKLMVILSDNSVGSPWVEKEVKEALEKERRQHKLVLFPIRLDDAVMQTQEAWAASLRDNRHIGEFTTWRNHASYQKAFERLLHDLKAEKTQAVAP